MLFGARYSSTSVFQFVGSGRQSLIFGDGGNGGVSSISTVTIALSACTLVFFVSTP
jgi:hypothetical protein